jgi:hypothetical protein
MKLLLPSTTIAIVSIALYIYPSIYTNTPFAINLNPFFRHTLNLLRPHLPHPLSTMTCPTTALARRIALSFPATSQSEGVGATVRRSIGTPRLRTLSPFLMLDHFTVQPGAGFPDHPHRGMETITYLLEGAVDHEDFAGNSGTIYSGDLQVMISCNSRAIRKALIIC